MCNAMQCNTLHKRNVITKRGEREKAEAAGVLSTLVRSWGVVPLCHNQHQHLQYHTDDIKSGSSERTPHPRRVDT